MAYPSISDYNNSIVDPDCFAEDITDNYALESVEDIYGSPFRITGGLGAVYKMQDEATNKFYALKVFTQEQPLRQDAYKKIYDFLKYEQSSYLAKFEYYPQGIYVDYDDADDDDDYWLPVVLMEWVNGMTLDKYIRNNIGNNAKINALLYRLSRMTQWLLSQPFAHGDIKPDNIMVRDSDESLVLVDYDGMFVPAMAGEKMRETGTSDWAHPNRSEAAFDSHIDDFSLSVLMLSVYAVILDPCLLSIDEENYERLTNAQIHNLHHLLTEVGFVENKKGDITFFWTKKDDEYYSMTEECWNFIVNGGFPDKIVYSYDDKEKVHRFKLMDSSRSSDKLILDHNDYKNISKSQTLSEMQKFLTDEYFSRLYSLFILVISRQTLAGISPELFSFDFSIKSNFVKENPSILSFTVKGVSFNMIYVEGGSFMMGATQKEFDAFPIVPNDSLSDSLPIHEVNLSSYYIAETQVTQKLWEAVMGNNPSYFTGDCQCPVESIYWNDCQEFVKKLNELTGEKFSLPTEAQWEYAAKGGNKSKGYIYSGSDDIDDVAWHHGNSGNRTHPVKTKTPNELGIYDMTGNVEEWCYDWYVDYENLEQTDPIGPSSSSYRVRRGGGWWFRPKGNCVSTRSRYEAGIGKKVYGFRLALRISPN